MSDFDTSPFDDARADIAALVMRPVRAWMQAPPALAHKRYFTLLLPIPLDLGAAGFEVTVTQGDAGWYVELKKALMPRSRLHLTGQARSYLSALYQLADSAEAVIGRLERKARKDHKKRLEDEGEVAA